MGQTEVAPSTVRDSSMSKIVWKLLKLMARIRGKILSFCTFEILAKLLTYLSFLPNKNWQQFVSEKEKFDHDNRQLLLDQNFAIGVVSICQLIACCLRPLGDL